MQQRHSKKPVPPVKDSPVVPLRPFSWKPLYAICAALAFLLYVNTLGHEYTVDDTTVMQNNKFTTQGIAGLDEIFTSSYRAGFWDRKEGLYRPLSVAMFAVEWELAPENPFPGHLMNVLLYGLTAAILLSTMRRMLAGWHPVIPLMVTLLWVFHPLHTEVVSNIKSRDEILAFLFGIISLRSLFVFSSTGRPSGMVVALLSFLLALLSKESSLTWIGVFPLALWCFTSSGLHRTLKLSAPFFALGIGYLALRTVLLGDLRGGYELMVINNSLVGAAGPGEQIATAFGILGKYLLLFLYPASLVFDYSFNTIPNRSFGDPTAIISLLIFGGALIWSLKKLPARNAYAFAILFFLGTIALVSNVFFLIEATMAERFMYTPSLGICLLTCLLAGNALKTNRVNGKFTLTDIRKNTLVMFLTPVLLILGARTVARNLDWKDNLTLLQHDVKISPQSARIRYALGSALLIEKALKEPDKSPQKQEYLDRAINELSTGVSILPNYNDAWYHLGIAYKEKEDAPNAVAAFEKARSYKAFSESGRLVNAGVAYGMNGQFDKALADLEQAVKLSPDDEDAWNNYGLYLSEAGKLEESLKALDKAISLKKDFYKAWYNRGNTLAKGGQYRGALAEYDRALRINDKSSDALNNSGNCYIMLQRPDSAILFFKRAMAADPGNAKAVMNLAITYQNIGDSTSARPYWEQARAMGLIQ